MPIKSKLSQYKQKRNLKSSKEPKAVIRKSKSKKIMRFPSEATKEIAQPRREGRSVRGNRRLLSFVIHSHNASHLHYDLRLEIDGVLKSWAIPKFPPMTKGIKRLAIQVEDHPLSYTTFHGIIPEGNYGAGKVEILDKGTYELIEKTQNKIEVFFHGKKLKGKYVLVKTNYDGKKSWWLFFKTS